MFYEIPANIYGDSHLLYGKRVVIVSASCPKMQLSIDVPVSEEVRKETNQWMIDFFGVKYSLPDTEILMVDDAFYMNPNAYQEFIRKIPPMMEIRRP